MRSCVFSAIGPRTALARRKVRISRRLAVSGPPRAALTRASFTGAPAIRESKATKRPRREIARDAVDDDDEDDEDEDSAERSSAMPNTTKQARAQATRLGGGGNTPVDNESLPCQMRALLEALPVVVSRVPLGSHRDLLGLLTEVFAAIINACAATPLESIATSSIGLGAHASDPHRRKLSCNKPPPPAPRWHAAISTLVREEQHGPTHIKLALTFQAFLPLLLLSCKVRSRARASGRFSAGPI